MVNIVALLTTKHEGGAQGQNGEQDFWREKGPEYVRKLFAGVRRWTKQPYIPWLLTDTDEYYGPPPSPYILAMSSARGRGWWKKLALFSPVSLLRGKTLYLDLDNVVCGPLDPLLDLEPDPLMMLDDRVYPGVANGSTMLCYPERLRYLSDEYAADPAKIESEFSVWPHASDQAYIANRVRAKTGKDIPYLQTLLPPAYCLNSRVELETGAAWDKTSLVFGSWEPKPHNSSHPLYKEHWKL